MIYRIAITILGVKVEPLLLTSSKRNIKDNIARLTLLIYSIIKATISKGVDTHLITRGSIHHRLNEFRKLGLEVWLTHI